MSKSASLPSLLFVLAMINGRNPTKMLARFDPKDASSLKDDIAQLSGEVAEWECVDYGRSDDPYPGQFRWRTTDPRWGWLWVPDEDLEPIEDQMV